MSAETPESSSVPQPVTDDSIQVRHLNHYQFSWAAGEPGAPGTFTPEVTVKPARA